MEGFMLNFRLKSRLTTRVDLMGLLPGPYISPLREDPVTQKEMDGQVTMIV
jgi:hypothetical protein